MYAPGAGRPSNVPPRLVLMPILWDGAQSTEHLCHNQVSDGPLTNSRETIWTMARCRASNVSVWSSPTD